MPRGKKLAKFFPMEKACNVCALVKPLTEYYMDRQAPDGHCYTCKACTSARWRKVKNGNRRNAIDYVYEVVPDVKFCMRCKKHKDFSEFSKNVRNRDGYCSWCKECTREYHRFYAKSSKGRKKRGVDSAREESGRNTEKLKFCFKCHDLKNVSEYYKDKSGELSTYCKSCTREYMNSYHKRKRQEKKVVEKEKVLDSENSGKIKRVWNKVCVFVKEGLFSGERVSE